MRTNAASNSQHDGVNPVTCFHPPAKSSEALNFDFVVGTSFSGITRGGPSDSPPTQRAWLWSASNGMTDLGTLGGSSSGASDINNLGQVVGFSNTITGATHAFRTAPNSAINPATDDLGTLSSSQGSTSFATGINDLGQVVGNSSTTTNYTHAFRTAPNSAINPATDDLGTLFGNFSYANSINNAGQVVGLNASQVVSPPASPFRTAPNSRINPATDNLSTLGAQANDINNLGQVVGFSHTRSNMQYAFRTAPNSPINPATDNLGTLSDFSTSNARAINDLGQVVGDSTITSGPTAGDIHAFLYSDGTMQDLNSLIPADSGWKLSSANDINNRGQIVGNGLFGGQVRAYLLTPVSETTPVPEPSSTPLSTLALGASWMLNRQLQKRKKLF